MAPSFGQRLLRWFDRVRRDLPWRRDTDPWRVWVSEIMLQQTRVEVVRKIYPDFMARYPCPADFARAGDDELLAAWKGLGYYRRARLLRQGAQEVVEAHGGAVPDDPEALAALPGIGAYTAGAVGSIAFGHRLPAVDGNVERVLARHLGIDTNVKVGAGKRAVRDAATARLDAARPGDFNQALMELGATVCTPRNPGCADCPVATDCDALRTGRTTELPVLPKRREAVEVQARVALIDGPRGQVVGIRVAEGEVNAGQLDLPGPGPLEFCGSAEELSASVFTRAGATIEVGPESARIRHGITHHRITVIAHRATLTGRLRPPLVLAPPDDPAVPWTTIARKVFTVR